MEADENELPFFRNDVQIKPIAMQPSPSRRQFLQRSLLTLGSLALRPAFAAEVTESHRIDPQWPTLSPDTYPGNCQFSGAAIAKDGSILGYNRGENPWTAKGFTKDIIQKPAVLVIDPQTGALKTSWGAGVFNLPHQISVDPKGNVWIVDAGGNKVFKFDAAGNKLLEIGGEAIGFNLPTDVTTLSDGSFVVTDGYRNSRVVKFDATGKQIAEWGKRGTGPLEFHTPHSVTSDENDLLYVADRGNLRVQVLNAKGEVQAIWTNVERPLTIRYVAGSLYVLSNLEGPKGMVRQLNKKGEILASFHTKPAGTKEDFERPHGMAVAAGGDDVYVGFVTSGKRLQRYRRVKG